MATGSAVQVRITESVVSPAGSVMLTGTEPGDVTAPLVLAIS